MAKRIPENELRAIEEAARRFAESVTAQKIAQALKPSTPLRTLQYRLKYLVGQKRLVQESSGRWAKYRIPVAPQAAPTIVAGEQPIPLSRAGGAIQEYLRQPVQTRKPAGYNRGFLNSYRPNVSAYLSPEERASLQKAGKSTAGDQPAGTHAKRILNRLLIDLSWNSSRLEGNTYSLLDTKRLFDFGHEAQGKEQLDAQMILNHKDAIEFLVGSAQDISFNRYTILNLHALLANNLLADPMASGRLRHIAVGNER